MKNIFTFLIALTATFVVGQSLPIDFDDTKDASFAGVDGSVFSVITDGTDKVGKIIGGQNQWNSNVGLTLDTWIDMTTTNKTITFDFYTSEAVVMNGLLQVSTEKSGGYPIEVKFSTDGAVGWETITLDFSTADNGHPNCQTCPDPKPVVFGEYAKISLFTNFGDTGTSTYWFDDIAGAANGGTVETCSDGVLNNGETAIDCGGPNCSPCITPPTTAAPTPPARAAADVFSLYSDTYTTGPTFVAFDAGWCGSPSYTAVTIAGNNTLKKVKGCHGIDFKSDKQDLSAFTKLHFDFYTADTDLTGDVFNVKLVDFGGGAGEASSLQVNINGASTPKLEANKWISVDVDITSLTAPVAGSLTRTDIAQFVITTTKSDNVWYDNIYLHKGTTASIEDLSNSFSIYPNPMGSQLTVEGISEVQHASIFDLTGREVLRAMPNEAVFTLDTADLQSGVYMLSLQVGDSEITKKLVK